MPAGRLAVMCGRRLQTWQSTLDPATVNRGEIGPETPDLSAAPSPSTALTCMRVDAPRCPLAMRRAGTYRAERLDLTSDQKLVPMTLPEAISADAAPAPMASADGQRACERASDETAERPEQPRRDHRPSLLIADDDAVVRYQLRAQLKDSFRIIAVADNTTDAKGVAGDALAETLARALHAEV